MKASVVLAAIFPLLALADTEVEFWACYDDDCNDCESSSEKIEPQGNLCMKTGSDVPALKMRTTEDISGKTGIVILNSESDPEGGLCAHKDTGSGCASTKVDGSIQCKKLMHPGGDHSESVAISYGQYCYPDGGIGKRGTEGISWAG